MFLIFKCIKVIFFILIHNFFFEKLGGRVPDLLPLVRKEITRKPTFENDKVKKWPVQPFVRSHLSKRLNKTKNNN